MPCIRPAAEGDLCRIAEIFVFNYRLNFYPIFLCDEFYFGELCVADMIEAFRAVLPEMLVYDDGTVKGFIQLSGSEVKRLFVEPVLQGQGIGARLLGFAVEEQGASCLWALEKNMRAIRFYERFGFRLTGEKKPEEDTEEFLVRMERL